MLSISQHWPLLHGRKEPLSSSAIGWIALAISIAAGSTFNGFAKVLTTALSPLSLLVLSEIVTWLAVVFTFGLLPTCKKLFSVGSEHIKPLLTIGICSGVAGPLLWFTGLEWTEAVNASFFGKTEAVFLIVLAHFFLGETFSRGHLLASVTILAGVLTITFQGFTTGLHLAGGDFLILAAALFYACGNITFRRYLTGVAPEVALLTRTSIAIATFFIVSPFLTHPFAEELLAFPKELIPAAIGFGLLSRFLNSFSFYQAIERIPVSTVSLISTLEVAGGALFAYLYVGESIREYHVIGGMFILLGTLVLELSTKHPKKQKEVTMPVTSPAAV